MNRTKEFWIAAGKRAAHTAAQAALATIGTAAMMDSVNWRTVVSTSVLAAIVSLLKSVVVGVPEVDV